MLAGSNLFPRRDNGSGWGLWPLQKPIVERLPVCSRALLKVCTVTEYVIKVKGLYHWGLIWGYSHIYHCLGALWKLSRLVISCVPYTLLVTALGVWLTSQLQIFSTFPGCHTASLTISPRNLLPAIIIMLNSIRLGKSTYVAFLDYSTAFSSVHREKLVFLRRNNGIVKN